MRLLPDDDETKLKQCRKCETWLPLDEFGLNSANINAGARDGKNINCKVCTRVKVQTQRQGAREYRATRKKVPEQYNLTDTKSSRRIARMLRKLSPADRVREAIRCGAETQTEIAQVTKLPSDGVTDCIAELLLDRREIRSQIVRNQRMYFIVEELPERKPNIKADIRSFHAMTALMPERLRA